jgi:predicted ribosomally synthesized peptide with nif11-like leader
MDHPATVAGRTPHSVRPPDPATHAPMSIANISAFLIRANTDTALAAKLQTIQASGEAGKAEAIVRLAAEEGLPFSVEEFLAAQDGAFSDEALDQVTGGVSIGEILKAIGAKAPPVVGRSAFP